MTRKLLPALLLVVAVIGGVKAFSCYHEREGARVERSRVRARELDSLKVRIQRLKTDSAKVVGEFARLRGDYVAQRQRLLDRLAARAVPRPTPAQPVPRETADVPLVDTPVVAAVAPLPDSAVAQFIQTADSTIAACSVVVINCERRAATEKARADTLSAENADLKRGEKMFWFIPLPSRKLSFAAGAGIATLIALLTR